MNSHIKTPIALFALFCFACNAKPKVTKQPLAQQKEQPAAPYDHYETGSDASTNYEKDTFDVADYSKLHYKDSTADCFDKSYIDTFSIANNKFRIIHEKSDSFPQVATLEKFVNGKWLMRLDFYEQNHYGNFSYTKDVNNDGYNDFVRSRFFDSEVYFYNPQKNDFIDSVCAITNPYVLVDSARNIFCDFQTYRAGCGEINSTLYTFKGFNKQVLYSLNLYNCDEHYEHNIITKLVLSKCLNGIEDSCKKIEETLLKEHIDIDDDKWVANGEVGNFFDFQAYWKSHYKKLLGYE